jgi:hypothetical protein
VVEELITSHRAEIGISPRQIDDSEIVDRLVYALVNEGARILEEGIAARASDIDVVYLTGYGFPPARGGPMFYADQVGLDQVLRRVREFARNPHVEPDSTRWSRVQHSRLERRRLDARRCAMPVIAAWRVRQPRGGCAAPRLTLSHQVHHVDVALHLTHREVEHAVAR